MAGGGRKDAPKNRRERCFPICAFLCLFEREREREREREKERERFLDFECHYFADISCIIRITRATDTNHVLVSFYLQFIYFLKQLKKLLPFQPALRDMTKKPTSFPDKIHLSGGTFIFFKHFSSK